MRKLLSRRRNEWMGVRVEPRGGGPRCSGRRMIAKGCKGLMVPRSMPMILIQNAALHNLQCRLNDGSDDRKYFILLGSFAPFSLQRLGGDLTCFSAFHSSCVDTRPRWIERSIGRGGRKQCFRGAPQGRKATEEVSAVRTSGW